MPIFMEISRVERTVLMVAQGEFSHDDFRKVTQDLIDANVAAFGKILDTSASRSNLSKEQVEEIAAMLRASSGGEARGPVACIIDPDRVDFAHTLAEVSKSDRPIKLFTSLHEARRWVAQTLQAAKPRPAGIAAAEALAEDRSHLRPVEETPTKAGNKDG
jgi:hypothetical protein